MVTKKMRSALPITSTQTAWVTGMSQVVMVTGFVVVGVFNLLVIVIISMLVKHWGLILLIA